MEEKDNANFWDCCRNHYNLAYYNSIGRFDNVHKRMNVSFERYNVYILNRIYVVQFEKANWNGKIHCINWSEAM